MKEQWKDIPGYEGYYMASTYGQVKSLIGQPKVLRPCITRRGYLHLVLSLNGLRKTVSVHRLVAMTFLFNDGYSEINHINGIKDDNRVENLEWCDRRRNVQHALDMGKYDNPVINTQTGIKYKSIKEAHRELLIKCGYDRFRVMLNGRTPNHTSFRLIKEAAK